MFSIIVPSFNRNAELNALLESLMRQTRQNFEVVIVDDCSQNAVKIDRTFDFPVRVIRNERNSGPAYSRNTGARQARREWLLFLDDDDRFAEEKCAVLSEVIERNPAVNFIYHPAACRMVNEHFTYVTHPYPDVRELTPDNLLAGNKIGGMPMIAVRKDFFFEINGLSTELKSLEDYDFILKAVSAPAFAPYYIDRALTECTFHTGRASVSTNTANTERAIADIRRRYVKTARQARNFELNALYMLAYPNIMNLSRKAAGYYFAMFKHSRSLKHLAIAIIILISPRLAINLKRLM